MPTDRFACFGIAAQQVLHDMMDHIGANNTFYQLAGMDINGLHGRGDGDKIAGADIDQRVADDVHGLFGGGSNSWGNGDLLALVINGIQPTFEVAWFLTLIFRRVGETPRMHCHVACAPPIAISRRLS